MADDVENDDQWLYGDAPEIVPTESELADPDLATEEKLLADSDQEQAESGEEKDEKDEGKDEEEIPVGAPLNNNTNNDQPEPPGAEEGEEEQNGEKPEKEDTDEDDDSDDDDINVVIGDITTSPAYPQLNIKRSGLISTVGDKSKFQQPQAGKFVVDEFDQMGTINGVPAGEFSMDSIEDKPWRKPGADITDYFNYGFNEDTWKAYCERQKRLRVNESGVGMIPLNAIGMPRGPMPIMNDNSKYAGGFGGVRKAGPPPGRRMTGAIDVIGGNAQAAKMDAPKENVIQVMTADRREYSRKPPGFPDMSIPPPQPFEEFQPEFGFNPEPEPFYGGYEPTQDVQWAPSNSWAMNDVKPLTPGPGVGLAAAPPPVSQPPPSIAAPSKTAATSDRIQSADGSISPRADESRERERDCESRARSEKPRERDRERDRSHRRERSRSRSRRHKSRSRSPSHRSHRKKKSRRHEESD